MKFILGRKIEMTQVYDARGAVVPVTLVEAGPCTVTQVRTPERDGYRAIQLGYGTKRHAAKPQQDAWGELGTFRVVREFRVPASVEMARGATIDVSSFVPGDAIQVVGTSKGRGFQGVVKRHHFSGSPASHGHKDQLRMPGSIGSKRQGPVEKGKRMAGRMGSDRVTVKNLEIVSVDAQKNQLAIRGALPGARGSLLLIQSV
ncbi:50S ribosomal protein L3 [Candidatus Uhrbacteria bacterium]|nr:50S ribosomal protein L3 [Candidatus Uhrbacteria bacterium]